MLCWVPGQPQLPRNKASAASHSGVSPPAGPLGVSPPASLSQYCLHGTELIVWKLFLLEKVRSALSCSCSAPEPTAACSQPSYDSSWKPVTPSNSTHHPHSVPSPQPLTPPWPWPRALVGPGLSSHREPILGYLKPPSLAGVFFSSNH